MPAPMRHPSLRAPSFTAATATALAVLLVNASFDVPGQTKPVPGTSSKLLIERDAELGTRSYSVNEGDCRISLTAFDSPPNRGIVQDRSVCSSPLSAQIPARSGLLAAVMSDSESSGPPRTLVWGRLTPDRRRDDLEMAFRLALAAHRSSSWDVKVGRPRSGNVNAVVVTLANQAMIYPELKQWFNDSGLELRFVSAEKVLIARAGTLAYFDRLKAVGVDAAEKLPFDCLAYFAISKMPDR